jgi:hypothetical protein
MRGRRGCTDEVRWKVKNEREEWKKKKNPDSSRISNFRPTYRGRDEKYIGSSSLPQPSGPYNTTLCVCVFACVCVSERGKNVDGNASDLFFLFLFYVFCICHQELCGSIADRPQGRCSTQSHTSRRRHTDDTLREEGGGGQVLPSAPDPTPRKKKRVARKRKGEVGWV